MYECRVWCDYNVYVYTYVWEGCDQQLVTLASPRHKPVYLKINFISNQESGSYVRLAITLLLLFFFSSSCLHLLLCSPSPSVPSLAVSSYTHFDSLLPLPRTSHTPTSLIPSSSCFRATLIPISSSSFTYFFFSALPFSFIFSSSFSSLIFPFPIPPACSLRPHPRRPPPGSRQKYFVMAWAGLGQAGEIVSPAAERMKTIKAEVRPAVPTWGGRQRWLITSSIANYLQRDLSTISAGDRNLHFVTRDWIVSYLVGQDSGWLGDGVGSNA